MEFFRRARKQPSTLGILPGTFNPVTIAHLSLADAGLEMVDEVLFVLPRVFPHKEWSGASFEDRVGMLQRVLADQSRVSIACTDRGLFAEIAQECREAYGPAPKLSFLCGADAAERIANWDYGDTGAFSRMMQEFDLLVADRGARFSLPHRRLPIPADHASVSATEVRERIARGEAWEHLVPESVHDEVRRIFGKPLTDPTG